MQGLALYIHIPFCVRKCNYCDFFSVVARPQDIEDYTVALAVEAAARGQQYDHPRVSTIYIGGGTPSLLPSRLIERVLEAVRGSFALDSDCEITMEANPGTVSHASWKSYMGAGVNRISLGVQSLDENILRFLGRIHTVQDVMAAVSSFRRMRIENYNLDLIYAIPGQTLEGLKRELVLLKSILGPHLSAYALEPGEGTPLKTMVDEGRIHLPSDDTSAAMYETLQEFAASSGLHQYELSNWAIPGRECRHNIAYWECRPYLGLGAGAVSRMGLVRTMNVRDVQAYIKMCGQGSLASEVMEEMDGRELARERMIMGLRLTRGLDLQRFEADFGRDVFAYFGDQINFLIASGMLEIIDGFCRLTPRSYLVANQVMCRF